MKHRRAVMGLPDVWPACDDGNEIRCACVRQGELVTPYETHATGFRSPHIPIVPSSGFHYLPAVPSGLAGR
jgi:hypothetical protein